MMVVTKQESVCTGCGWLVLFLLFAVAVVFGASVMATEYPAGKTLYLDIIPKPLKLHSKADPDVGTAHLIRLNTGTSYLPEWHDQHVGAAVYINKDALFRQELPGAVSPDEAMLPEALEVSLPYRIGNNLWGQHLVKLPGCLARNMIRLFYNGLDSLLDKHNVAHLRGMATCYQVAMLLSAKWSSDYDGVARYFEKFYPLLFLKKSRFIRVDTSLMTSDSAYRRQPEPTDELSSFARQIPMRSIPPGTMLLMNKGKEVTPDSIYHMVLYIGNEFVIGRSSSVGPILAQTLDQLLFTYAQRRENSHTDDGQKIETHIYAVDLSSTEADFLCD